MTDFKRDDLISIEGNLYIIQLKQDIDRYGFIKDSFILRSVIEKND